jgi:hypothetical protein
VGVTECSTEDFLRSLRRHAGPLWTRLDAPSNPRGRGADGAQPSAVCGPNGLDPNIEPGDRFPCWTDRHEARRVLATMLYQTLRWTYAHGDVSLSPAAAEYFRDTLPDDVLPRSSRSRSPLVSHHVEEA